MIRSMTGFGRADFDVEGLAFSVEIRTVNHRHLDVATRLPRALSPLEPEVKQALRERFDRGKADVTEALAAGESPRADLEIDRDEAGQYLAFARELQQNHDLGGELDVAGLLALPGVTRLVEHALPEEPLAEALRGALEAALTAVDTMRRKEGEAIDAELRTRLGRVDQIVAEFESRAAEVVEAARARLRKRAEQIRDETGLLDEARLHQEIVIAADRLDVREELVRLRSHVAQFRGVLDGAGPGEPAGRRMEFLLQELVREANTVGSKATDAPIAHRVVDLKTELERIREQVLNVE